MCLCWVAQSCLTLCDPMDCSPSASSVHGDSPCKHTGVGCHALLQGIFPTYGSKPGLLHCRQILYQLSYLRNPIKHKLKLLNSLLYHFKWLPHIQLCAHNMIYLINLNLGVSILFYYKQWNNKHPQSSPYQNTNRIFHINRIK